MKNNSTKKYFTAILCCLVTFFLIFTSGCATRESKPIVLVDSTLYYQSIAEKENFNGILLANKISKKTGKPIKPGTIFGLDGKAKLYAVIENEFSNDRELMFHIDWIDSKGNSFYRKQVDIAPKDSISTITSSISLSPQKRFQGSYTIRLYMFRELIAEKNFQLLDSAVYSEINKEKLKSNIKQSAKKDSKKKIQKVKSI